MRYAVGVGLVLSGLTSGWACARVDPISASESAAVDGAEPDAEGTPVDRDGTVGAGSINSRETGPANRRARGRDAGDAATDAGFTPEDRTDAAAAVSDAAAPEDAPEDLTCEMSNGMPCSNDLLGACEREGAYECLPDGTLNCSAEPATGSEDVCGDDIDNDCDGLVDTGCAQNACGGWSKLKDDKGAACTAGTGDCAVSGTYQCDGEESTLCDAAPKPDNGCGGCRELPNLGDSCTAGSGDCAQTGRYVCSGSDRTECDAEPKPDNGCGGCRELPNLGDSCTAGSGDCAQTGRYRCRGATATECDAEPKADNGCGGCAVLSNLGDRCTATDGSCTGSGTFECDGATRTRCIPNEELINACGTCGEAPAEDCRDNTDDNCNGDLWDGCPCYHCFIDASDTMGFYTYSEAQATNGVLMCTVASTFEKLTNCNF